MTRPDSNHPGGPFVDTPSGSTDALDERCSSVVQLGRSSCEGSIAALARRLVSEMDPRLITVLDLRLDRTLAEVGARFGVSRERVRQLETKAKNQLLPLVRDWAAPFEQSWRERLRSFAASEEELFGELINPTLDVESQNRVGRLALTTLIPEASHPFGFRGTRVAGWWTIDTMGVHRRLRVLAGCGPLTDPELDAVLANLEVPSSFPTRVVLNEARSPLRFHLEASAWVRSRACHRDAAVALLRQRGEPMVSSDLARKLGLNPKALNANLVRDHRVRQIRPSGLWTLVDWVGGDELDSGFQSTVEAVTAVLREHGPLRRRDLVHRVMAVYPVSSWAVLNALESETLGQSESGLWDLVERGARPAAPRRPPQKPATVTESDDGRALTFYRAVDGELLRGSGLGVNPYVGWRVGLRRPGDKRIFVSAIFAPVTVRRSFGSCNISTLRLQVAELGGESGDVLAIVLGLVSGQYEVHLVGRNR